MTVGYAKFEVGDVVISTLDDEIIYGPLVVKLVNYNPDQHCYMYVIADKDDKSTISVAFEYELDLYSEFAKQKKVSEEVKEWLE